MAASTRDDSDLLEACATGDERALGCLYDRFGRRAYGLALRVLGDAALAEDAVQDAFLDLWRSARRYDRARGTAAAWILTLVHRRAVDLVRRQRRFNALTPALEALMPRTPGESGEEHVDLRNDLEAALLTLSDDEREVLALAYWKGLTQAQIATTLGIPLGTVKSRTFAALARARDALAERPAAA